MLFNVLNDEFVVGHIGLVPAHLPGHILFSMHTPGLPLLLLVDAIFENKYFTR